MEKALKPFFLISKTQKFKKNKNVYFTTLSALTEILKHIYSNCS